jgi:predicted secreted protein
MRQLGLNEIRCVGLGAACLLAALASACKASPEPSPAEASSPVGAPASEPPPVAPTAPDSASAAPPAPSSAPAATERTYAEGTKTITAKVGERFSIALPSNITIPMKWRIEPPPDAKLLALVEEKHHDEPPPGCDGCTGYGGTRLFHFEAKGAGKSTLHFALKPLTNPGAKAEKEVTIEVVTAP